jgi:gp178
MNKQEFIERIKSLKNIFGNKCEYIEIDAVIELASELDEPQKVAVPQFVADWYEEYKDDFEIALFRCIDHIPSVYDEGDLNEFEEWIIDGETKPFQTLVNMHQFGYEVEKEKRYLVKLKGIKSSECYLNCVGNAKNWIVADKTEHAHILTKHTRKELEEAGFGEVFNSPLFEVEEVAE